MTDLCIDMQDVHNASLILWYVATGLDLMELSIYALCVYRKNVSDCSTTSCAFDFSVGCTPL